MRIVAASCSPALSLSGVSVPCPHANNRQGAAHLTAGRARLGRLRRSDRVPCATSPAVRSVRIRTVRTQAAETSSVNVTRQAGFFLNNAGLRSPDNILACHMRHVVAVKTKQEKAHMITMIGTFILALAVSFSGAVAVTFGFVALRRILFGVTM